MSRKVTLIYFVLKGYFQKNSKFDMQKSAME